MFSRGRCRSAFDKRSESRLCENQLAYIFPLPLVAAEWSPLLYPQQVYAAGGYVVGLKKAKW